MLTEIPSESVVGESTIDVQENAYIFATYESTTVDSMTEEISDGRTKSFTKVSHGYTLDLGYCTAGTQVRIKNSIYYGICPESRCCRYGLSDVK